MVMYTTTNSNWNKPYYDAMSARANTASLIAKQASEQRQSVRNEAFRTKLAGWYGMYKQAEEEKAVKIKKTTPKLRHFIPTGTTLSPSLLAEAVGMDEAQQNEANTNSFGLTIGNALGGLMGLAAAGVPAALATKDPMLTGASALIGGLGGWKLGDYIAHKAIQKARGLGSEADYRPSYLLPFTGAHQSIALAGATKAQQDAATGEAAKNLAATVPAYLLAQATARPMLHSRTPEGFVGGIAAATLGGPLMRMSEYAASGSHE